MAILTVREIARELQVSEDAVYGWVRRGAIPGVIRIEGTVRIDGDKFYPFLAAGGQLGSSAPKVDDATR